jgi:hypothetical protein
LDLAARFLAGVPSEQPSPSASTAPSVVASAIDSNVGPSASMVEIAESAEGEYSEYGDTDDASTMVAAEEEEEELGVPLSEMNALSVSGLIHHPKRIIPDSFALLRRR